METTADKNRFNGLKIKEARELHRMDISQLSIQTGISRQSIAKYENGHYTPKPENLAAISRVLKVKWGFFAMPTLELNKPIFFRSLSAATKNVRISAARTLDMIESVVGAIENFTSLPPLNLPSLDFPNPELITPDQIEESAMACRKLWGLGIDPIDDLIGHMEMAGIVVYTSEIESDALDAFTRWSDDGRPYVHLCSNKNCAVRSRFNLAHELGHLILHRNINKNDLRYAKYFNEFENQANLFAGAFLLPEESFVNDLTKISLDYFAALKPKWKVSVGAMIKRSAQLGLIGESDEKSHWINYSRRGWRKREPHDDNKELIPDEEPLWIREAIKSLLETKEASPSEILSRIPYDNDFIAQFFNLDILRIGVELGDQSDSIRKNIIEGIQGVKARIIEYKVAQ